MFGHERGAFTGAVSARAGRFEIANGGTLFLDEVGDLPLAVQPKLLRALQEHEFERLGAVKTIRADVRVIAATNRELPVMADAGEFRRDLYYRLNVFPIRLPPLRERRDDIPALVRHFTQKYAQQLKRSITSIPAAVMDRLSASAWPGNIRELENMIERAVILSRDGVLSVPPHDLQSHDDPCTEHVRRGNRLKELQRDAILSALREARGIIGGPEGAAARLGIKRTTLQSRMRKLGIRRPPF
jgi:formate hydrogenlyase transcriptional activator